MHQSLPLWSPKQCKGEITSLNISLREGKLLSITEFIGMTQISYVLKISMPLSNNSAEPSPVANAVFQHSFVLAFSPNQFTGNW